MSDQKYGAVQIAAMHMQPGSSMVRFIETEGGAFYEWWQPGSPGGATIRYRAEDFEYALVEARQHPYHEATPGIPASKVKPDESELTNG